jgi:hypothetical protein
MPGVGLPRGDGQRDQVTIRGFTAIADRFVDGLRGPARTYCGTASARNVDFSEPELTALGFTLNHRIHDQLSIRSALSVSTFPGHTIK